MTSIDATIAEIEALLRSTKQRAQRAYLRGVATAYAVAKLYHDHDDLAACLVAWFHAEEQAFGPFSDAYRHGYECGAAGLCR